MRIWKRNVLFLLAPGLFAVATGCGGGSTVSGCSGSQCTGCSGSLCPVPAGSIYVLSGLFANQIYQFSQTASGAVPPTATIKGPSTLTDSLQALAIDAAGNIYVGDATTPNGFQILVYPPGANGAAKPSKTIPTTLANAQSAITSLEVDAAGNIYASAFGEIAVIFESSGDVAGVNTVQSALQHGELAG